MAGTPDVSTLDKGVDFAKSLYKDFVQSGVQPTLENFEAYANEKGVGDFLKKAEKMATDAGQNLWKIVAPDNGKGGGFLETVVDFFKGPGGGIAAGILAVLAAMGLGDFGLMGALVIGALVFFGVEAMTGQLGNLFGGSKTTPPPPGGNVPAVAPEGPAAAPAVGENISLPVTTDPKNKNNIQVTVETLPPFNGQNYEVVLRGKTDADGKNATINTAVLINTTTRQEMVLEDYTKDDNGKPITSDADRVILPVSNGTVQIAKTSMDGLHAEALKMVPVLGKAAEASPTPPAPAAAAGTSPAPVIPVVASQRTSAEFAPTGSTTPPSGAKTGQVYNNQIHIDGYTDATVVASPDKKSVMLSTISFQEVSGKADDGLNYRLSPELMNTPIPVTQTADGKITVDLNNPTLVAARKYALDERNQNPNILRPEEDRLFNVTDQNDGRVTMEYTAFSNGDRTKPVTVVVSGTVTDIQLRTHEETSAIPGNNKKVVDGESGTLTVGTVSVKNDDGTLTSVPLDKPVTMNNVPVDSKMQRGALLISFGNKQSGDIRESKNFTDGMDALVAKAGKATDRGNLYIPENQPEITFTVDENGKMVTGGKPKAGDMLVHATLDKDAPWYNIDKGAVVNADGSLPKNGNGIDWTPVDQSQLPDKSGQITNNSGYGKQEVVDLNRFAPTIAGARTQVIEIAANKRAPNALPGASQPVLAGEPPKTDGTSPAQNGTLIAGASSDPVHNAATPPHIDLASGVDTLLQHAAKLYTDLSHMVPVGGQPANLPGTQITNNTGVTGPR